MYLVWIFSKANKKQFILYKTQTVWVLTWAYLAIVPHPVRLHDALEARCELVGSQQRGRSVGTRYAVHKRWYGGIAFSLLKNNSEIKFCINQRYYYLQKKTHWRCLELPHVKYLQVWVILWPESILAGAFWVRLIWKLPNKQPGAVGIAGTYGTATKTTTTTNDTANNKTKKHDRWSGSGERVIQKACCQ